MKIKCLVVDDEKLAQEVLVHHISKFSNLQLEGICNNVIELIQFLNKHTDIDLIFLDIKMPEISGTDFISIYNNPPAIIYTTAYDQYALDAFTQNAIDYLLKPISLDRFAKSVQKASKFILRDKIATPVVNSATESFYVKSDKRLVKINGPEMILIEGMRNYFCIHTETDTIMVHGTLSTIEENLQHLPYICRVHKSFFINLNQISYVEQHVVLLKNRKSVPIGLSYREQVYQKLNIM
ncbi:response regulator transcription factor [Marnyiella aurantia]|uniref:Response regulator transcription factor n=1 Tax=Marnyiella aurantia TaxID=2758037 RepID=A0A7D7QKV4_9FLAO|nr:response regulator transcription factor [Marnyiella aurantia]MBA5245961.1 response regulator transcription factor [Marnyiella aurantia]QMS98645.1 response regulator transcription factor [Marnyiella aurantia]